MEGNKWRKKLGGFYREGVKRLKGEQNDARMGYNLNWVKYIKSWAAAKGDKII